MPGVFLCAFIITTYSRPMTRHRIIVIAGVIQKEGEFLLAQRAQHDSLPGKWEFPGGTLEPGESHQECLEREMREEFEIETKIGAKIGISEHPYPKGVIELHTYHVEWLSGSMVLNEHDDIRWVAPQYLLEYDLAPGDVPIARILSGPMG